MVSVNLQNNVQVANLSGSKNIQATQVQVQGNSVNPVSSTTVTNLFSSRKCHIGIFTYHHFRKSWNEYKRIAEYESTFVPVSNCCPELSVTVFFTSIVRADFIC
jgi:hypothetical protein